MRSTTSEAAWVRTMGFPGRAGVVGWLLAVAAVFGCTAKAEEAPKTTAEMIVFEAAGADFGAVQANTVVHKELLLRNTSKKTVTFSRVTSSCSSCASGTVESRPIEPGDSATLKMEFRAPGVNGDQAKTLYVFLAGETGAPVRIPVKAVVTGGIEPGQPATPMEIAPARVPVSAVVEPPLADLGFVRPEQTETMTVNIRNTGSEPIRFNGKVTTNCSCASGEISPQNEDIAPGDSATLTVKMEAGPNVGLLRRELAVWTTNAQSVKVPVQATVTQAVNAEPFFINLLAGTSGTIALESVDKAPFRVLKAGGKAPMLEGGDSEGKAARHVLTWDMTGVAPDDVQPWYIIETDHPDAPMLDLRVIHMGLLKQTGPDGEPWTLSHDRMLLGKIRPGQTFERKITLVKLMADTLESIESPDGSFEAMITKREATPKGMEYTITITATAASTGSGKLLLKTTEPAHTSTIHLFGKMEDAR